MQVSDPAYSSLKCQRALITQADIVVIQTIDVRLDDTDVDITYHGKWDKTKSSLNFVHSDTLTSTTTSGSSFSCTYSRASSSHYTLCSHSLP